ncbi:MAG TPA: methyltransferase domain-containing protein [Deltaproteobacteria bacterium]|nr:methyltransferase domain-containing protein [Deltaproteobacteria bacterium]
MAHRFDPAMAGRLMSEERYGRLDPVKFLKGAGLAPGDSMVDLGCGPGFFALAASAVVGPEGRVWALDVEPEMLGHLRRQGPPPNVFPLVCPESELPLRGGCADFVLLAFVIHEAAEPLRLLREVRRVMKPGAALCILDWEKVDEDEGPPLEERMAAAEAEALAGRAGLSVTERTAPDGSWYAVRAVRPLAAP